MKPSTHARKKLVKVRHKALVKARRPAHKKLLLHPATLFLLLCTGVLLSGMTLRAHADPTDTVSYNVRGKVPADPLTEPAIITNPTDGQKFTSTPIDVKGTCPYKSYINLDRNDIFAGSTLCQPDGTFSLQLGLLEGANKLQAHVFNVTDDEGPLSSPITVYYSLPQPTPPVITPGSSTPSAVKPTAKPFVISSQYQYVGHKVGENVSWQLDVSAGEPPYALNVKWGDGSESNYVMKNSGSLTIEHVYEKAGFFPIKITGSDALGGQAFLQLGSLMSKDGQAGFSATGSTGESNRFKHLNYGWLNWFWPLYLIVFLMVLSFWLGERQEYYELQRRYKRPHRLV